MSSTKTTTRPRKSKTANGPKNAPPRWGWLKQEYMSYAIVWFAGLAMGAWLF